MDGTALLVGISIGGLVVGIAAFFLAKFATRADASTLESTRIDLAEAVAERDALRSAGQTARSEADSAKALLAAAQQTVTEQRGNIESERTRTEQEAALRAKTQQELRASEARMSEREESMRQLLAEREKSIAELRVTMEQSKVALTEAFKATGADVLKVAAEDLIKRAKDQFDGHSRLTQEQLDARQKAMDATLTPLREQLVKQEELVKQLGEKREGDAKTLGEQLKQIAELQLKASSAAQQLQSAMRDNRQRGQWGEVALKNIVEMAGLAEGVSFTEQESLKGEEGRLRPDMVVRLPGDRFIAIDAKVPLSAYLQSNEADISDQQRKELLVEHAKAVRAHVRTLHSRDYAKAVKGDVEFVALFIPVESAFSAAFAADPSLHGEALDVKVLIVTPSTLLALLRTVALHWRSAKSAENAAKICAEATELVKRVEVFVDHFGGVGEKLKQATGAYNKAVSSFESRFLPSVNRVADLLGRDGVAVPVKLDDAVSPLALPPAEVAAK